MTFGRHLPKQVPLRLPALKLAIAWAPRIRGSRGWVQTVFGNCFLFLFRLKMETSNIK